MHVTDSYGFIYITTNMINGKRYIGQKKFDNGSRWKSYLGSGSHLQNAISKYGKKNFARNIVSIAFSPEDLNKLEKQWIEDSNAIERDDYYNKIEGGDVISGLKKYNAIPCVCIDNGQVFETLLDASAYSGMSPEKIKDSFDDVHTYNYINEGKVFRKLECINDLAKLCPMCGGESGKLIYRGFLRPMCNVCKKEFKRQMKLDGATKDDLVLLYRKELRDLIVDLYNKGFSISKISELINMEGFGTTYIKNFLTNNKVYKKRRRYYYTILDEQHNIVNTFHNTYDLTSWVYDNLNLDTKAFDEILHIIDLSIIKEDVIDEYRFKLVNAEDYKEYRQVKL